MKGFMVGMWQQDMQYIYIYIDDYRCINYHPGVEIVEIRWNVQRDSHCSECSFENSIFYLLQDDYIYIMWCDLTWSLWQVGTRNIPGGWKLEPVVFWGVQMEMKIPKNVFLMNMFLRVIGRFWHTKKHILNTQSCKWYAEWPSDFATYTYTII